MNQSSKTHSFPGVVGLMLAATFPMIPFLFLSTYPLIADAIHLQDGNTLSDWNPLIHMSHNAFLSWRLLPSLTDTTSASITRGLLGYGVLLSCGVYLLSSLVESSRTLFWLFLAGPATFLLLVSLFGLDAVLLGTLCCFPWCLLFVHIAPGWSSSSPFMCGTAALLLGFGVAFTANQFGILVLGISLLFAARSSGSNGKGYFVALALLTLPSFWVTLTAPFAPFPDYPGGAHLVPDDGLPGHLHSLITSSYPLPVIDRLFVRETYSQLALAVTVLVAFAYLLLWKKPGWRSHMLAIALTTSSLCLIDTMAPEWVSQIAPVAVVARNLPHALFFPLTPILLGMVIVVLLSSFDWKAHLVTFAFGTTLLIFRSHLNDEAALLQRPDAARALHSATDYLTRFPEQRQRVLQQLISPSYSLGNALELELDPSEQLRFVSARPFLESVHASQVTDSRGLKVVTDHHKKSRWSTGSVMKGGEWLHLRFANPVLLNGIELDPGAYPTDFPAGVRISFRPDCPALSEEYAPEPADMYRELLSRKPWEGELRYSPHGYPYFGSQSRVRLRLPHAESIQCLLVEQTGKRSFEWSVAEIRISGDFEHPASQNSRGNRIR